MRIDAYNKINQIYQTNEKLKVHSVEKAKEKDGITISRAGRDYQVAQAALAKVPNVRQDKVDELKARIDAGTYVVKDEDFAAKLLKNYEKFTF